MRNHIKRVEALERRTGAIRQDRRRLWGDEIEAKIDRVLARPDHEDFGFGLWGQVFDKDGKPFERQKPK